MIESSSAKSSFRELDEVFLQTQTRIWLGEVLNTRLDEDLPISDLLQDGDILFEVSKIVWDKLLTKCIELRHLKHKYRPFGSKRSSGRYRPYSNVDSFLKICKILGLSGIDLFSPSDVVEKRDIRKVCICIRALSKKARSKQLSVPDFDLVINSVSMPSDMVGGIRRSLESSQWTLSSSSSYTSHKAPRMKLKQKKLSTPSGRDDDSSSDESDEAESRYMGENSFPSAGDNSPEVHSSFDVSHINKEHIYNCKNRSVGVSDTEFNDGSVVGDSSCIKTGESNYISDYLAFSDLMVHASDGSDPVILDGEKNMFDFFLNQNLGSDEKCSQRKFLDDEDMEVSSTTSMSSVLGRLLNLELDEQFDAEDSSSANVCSSLSMEQSNLENAFNLDNGTKSDLSDVTSNHLNFSSNDKPFEVVIDDAKIQSPVVEEKHLCETISENDFPLFPVKAHINGDEISSADGKVINQDKREDDIPVKHGNKKPLLKTVVKGTAIAGVLFLLMQIRKSRGKNDAYVSRYNGSNSSLTKQQAGNRGKGIYPAEKIKLGN